MRNKFGGVCYRCNTHVPPGAGHFERFRGGWRVQHAECAIQHRGTVDPDRATDRQKRREKLAQGTGRAAQRARRNLRKEAAE